MRIAISGTANQGKTTLVQDFLRKWTNYRTPAGSYRDVMIEGEHSSKASEDNQWNVLNWMVDEQSRADKDDNVIFDRCTLDNFVYTILAIKKGNIAPEYINKCMNLIKESFRNLDIIFLLGYDPSIKLVDQVLRDTDVDYIKEVDNVFQGIYHQYVQGDEKIYTIFPKDDMPAIIPIYGSRTERLAQIGDYIDVSGGLIETDEKDSVLSEEKLAAVQALMTAQQKILGAENLEAFEKKLKI
jgi:hypothetical protein